MAGRNHVAAQRPAERAGDQPRAGLVLGLQLLADLRRQGDGTAGPLVRVGLLAAERVDVRGDLDQGRDHVVHLQRPDQLDDLREIAVLGERERERPDHRRAGHEADRRLCDDSVVGLREQPVEQWSEARFVDEPVAGAGQCSVTGLQRRAVGLARGAADHETVAPARELRTELSEGHSRLDQRVSQLLVDLEDPVCVRYSSATV